MSIVFLVALVFGFILFTCALPVHDLWAEQRLIRKADQGKPVIQLPSIKAYDLVDKSGDYFSQWHQDSILEPILGTLGKGFFVESGAYDGETYSNTLYYEMKHGWSGLLIEPNPRLFVNLTAKHRRAYAFNGCLSPDGQAKNVQFADSFVGAGRGSIKTGQNDNDAVDKSYFFGVEAWPLHALLEAVGRRTVDFWSLDIEGSEGSVLLNTDFSKVEVGVLLVEMNKNGKNDNDVYEAMQRAGFKEVGHTCYDKGKLDGIFINPNYFKERNLEVPTADVLEPCDFGS